MPAQATPAPVNGNPFVSFGTAEENLHLTYGFIENADDLESDDDAKTAITDRLRELEGQTGISTLFRIQTTTSLGILRMLGEGYTVEDIFSDRTEQQRREESRALSARINGLSASNPAEIGRFCREFMAGMQAQVLPPVDLSDYEQTSRHAHILNTMWQASMDYSQLFSRYWENPEFQRGFLNSAAGETWDNTFHDQLEPMIDIARSLSMLTVQEAPETVSRIDDVISRFLTAQYGQVFQSTRTLPELADLIDGKKMYDIVRFVKTAAARPDYLQEMSDYAENPDKQLSPGLLRALEGNVPGSAFRHSEPLSKPVFPKECAARLFRPANWYDPALRGDIDTAFQQMFDSADLQRTARVMRREGYPVESPIQLFHIGNQSVDAYLTSNHIELNDENRKAAIVQASAMAREHVSRIGFTVEKGVPQPAVVEIQADLEAFRGMEGFFQKSRPRRASQLYASDQDMAARHAQILRGFAASQVAAMETSAPAAAAQADEDSEFSYEGAFAFHQIREDYAGTRLDFRYDDDDLSEINLRNALLRALDVDHPESVRADEAARILNDPENLPRAAAFISEFAHFAERRMADLEAHNSVSPEDKAFYNNLKILAEPAKRLATYYDEAMEDDPHYRMNPAYTERNSADILADTAALSYVCTLLSSQQNLAVMRPERAQMTSSLRMLVRDDAARQARPEDAYTAMHTGQLPRNIQTITDQFVQSSQKLKIGLQGISGPAANASNRPQRSAQRTAQNQMGNQGPQNTQKKSNAPSM